MEGLFRDAAGDVEVATVHYLFGIGTAERVARRLAEVRAEFDEIVAAMREVLSFSVSERGWTESAKPSTESQPE